MAPDYILGLDLGQADDFTALIGVRPEGDIEPTYNVGHIERVPLKTRYPVVVDHVGALVDALRQPVSVAEPVGVARYGLGLERGLARPDVTLVLDYTGVGRPVADMFVDAKIDCSLILVSIHGGDRVTRNEDTGDLGVPKRDLAGVVQRVLHERRIEIPDDHPMAATLTSELAGFRAKISLTGHDSYGAGGDWRSAPHDDLVLALALSLWWAEYPLRLEIY